MCRCIKFNIGAQANSTHLRLLNILCLLHTKLCVSSRRPLRGRFDRAWCCPIGRFPRLPDTHQNLAHGWLQVKLGGGFRLPAFVRTPQPGREPPAELPAPLDHLRERDARRQRTEAFRVGQGEFQARRSGVMGITRGRGRCRIFLGCHISETGVRNDGRAGLVRGGAPVFPHLRRPWKCDAATLA